jgi:hypothetical protein
MRWKLLKIIAILSCFEIVACKPEISESNINAVNQRFEKLEASKKFLSTKEVESILGQPDRTENATLELETQKKQVAVTRYYYEQDGQTIELHFFDNKLIDRVPAFSKTPEPEPPKP